MGIKEIATTARILEPVRIMNNGELHIEPDVLINPFVSIIAETYIRIGEGTQIASGVSIVDADHEMEDLNAIGRIGKKEPISIGQYCWIGANAVILKGVTLGNYCIVGAGAIVDRSFPEGSVLVGNPARILRIRKLPL